MQCKKKYQKEFDFPQKVYLDLAQTMDINFEENLRTTTKTCQKKTSPKGNPKKQNDKGGGEGKKKTENKEQLKILLMKFNSNKWWKISSCKKTRRKYEGTYFRKSRNCIQRKKSNRRRKFGLIKWQRCS